MTALRLGAVGVLGIQVLYLAARALGDVPNPCDDYVAYVPLADRLSETGGMIEPFSQRRVTGLGGATVLHSLFATTLGTDAIFAADIVVGGLLVGLLLVPLLPELSRLFLGVVLLASFSLWQSLQANLSPTYIVVALTAAALLLVAETGKSRSMLLDHRILMLVGLLGAGLLTLRVAFAIPVALFGVVLIARANDARAQIRLRAVVVLGLAVGLPTVPWMIALWRSSGTPLYPPFNGNLDRSWPGFRAPGVDPWTNFGDVIAVGELRWMLVGIAAAAVTLNLRRGRSLRAEVPLLAMPGVIITIALTVVSLSAFRSSDIARYMWPILAGALVATLVLLANEAAPKLRHAGGAFSALILISVACVLATPVDRVLAEIHTGWKAAVRSWSGYAPVRDLWVSMQDDYADIQASLPAGAKVATASDYPHLFDLTRNDVLSLDVLGSVSPPPGMPLRGTAREITQYLREEGFEFVVATDPARSTCLYNREVWQSHLARGARPWASWAPYFLDWFGWLEARAAESPGLVRDHGTLITFDLRKDRAADDVRFLRPHL